MNKLSIWGSRECESGERNGDLSFSSAPRGSASLSPVLAWIALLAQIGELANRLRLTLKLQQINNRRALRLTCWTEGKYVLGFRSSVYIFCNSICRYLKRFFLKVPPFHIKDAKNQRVLKHNQHAYKLVLATFTAVAVDAVSDGTWSFVTWTYFFNKRY